MLVPERGDPTTKIGLFVLRSILVLGIIHLFAASQASHSVRMVPAPFFLLNRVTTCREHRTRLERKILRCRATHCGSRVIIRIYRALCRIYGLLNESDQD